MAWVGHRDSKMVTHYRHLRDEDGQRKMKQINFFGTESDADVPPSPGSQNDEQEVSSTQSTIGTDKGRESNQ